jgi:hydroxymethylbilane synthase
VSRRELVIGTRGSELALWQAKHTQALLMARFPEEGFPLQIIKTQGDRIQDHALYKVEDKGFFTKEIEAALLTRQIDIAVHSLKDLPTESPPGLAIGAVPAREDARDVWVARGGGGPHDLPAGGRVGTSSLRRQAQLRALRSDLAFVDLRGNVPTRLRRLEEGALDAVVLARAGLARLGILPAEARELPLEWMLPAPGQGALAIQVRADDAESRRRVGELEDRGVRLAVTAERAFLSRLQGGCLVPVGAHAFQDGDELLRGERKGRAGTEDDAAALGNALADDLLARGAGPVLERVRQFLRASQSGGGAGV